MSQASESTQRVAGNFRNRISDPERITFNYFSNPWNFYSVLSQEDTFVVNWCIRNGLLHGPVECGRPGCAGELRPAKRAGKLDGATLRCTKNSDHEMSVRKNTFFERSKLTIQDVMMFTKTYLDGASLLLSSRHSGVAYGSTAIDWGSFIREVFKEYYQRYLKNVTLEGEIEVDESLFGRKIKYNKCDRSKGLRIWVFGMVERSSNSIILYPVEDRRAATLVPLIERHVKKGSTIYSDGWSAYCQLNELGYRHFTVLYKYTFRKDFKNEKTGEIVTVNTNMIEGAWKHAKDYFRRMSATMASQWESHMAEVMWRSRLKGNVYSVFTFLKEVFPTTSPPNYTYTTPLFDSWLGPYDDKDFVEKALSDANSETEPEDDSDKEADEDMEVSQALNHDKDDLVEEATHEDKARNKKTENINGGKALKKLKTVKQTPDLDRTLTEKLDETINYGELSKSQRKKPSKTDNICAPDGYVQVREDRVKRKPKPKKSLKPKLPSDWSDDDDFQ